MSIGFYRDRIRIKRELTNNKSQKGKYRLRIILKNVFGSAKHQEKATYGLGYKLASKRKSDNSVLNRDNAISIGKYKINTFEL